MSAEASSSSSSSSSEINFQNSSSIQTNSMASPSNVNMGFSERALSAAGAAFLSAIIVNPLDVAKTRLQAQAAGVPFQNLSHTCSFGTNTMLPDTRCFPSCYRSVLGEPSCSPYKGTLDVFYKVIRQEGFGRLWRGTTASLALSVPTVGIYLPCYDILCNFMEEYSSQNAPSMTPYVPLVAGSVARSLACITCYPIELARTRMQAFKDTRHGKKPPGVLKTLDGVISTNRSTGTLGSSLHRFRFLWTGLGAQLARDVPFSAICWATLEPVRRQIFAMSAGDVSSPVTVVGANFCGGFVAGCLAGACTCPLDVAKTRRQIEKDQVRAMKMTTRQTLIEIWRDGGMKGLFMGVGPRVARAGPSVGIVVSFYEVVKYVLHNRKYQTKN
ncbi:unnamed protein product [Lactuca virosa]|uniref:Mitochondrial carrier protein n=1 Tax=Lactuca virosa TaxID=75947 RepID=A0AAU9LCG7_9ASTR|nr:unnamed protein product [Lactuca virosa]